MGIAEAIAIIMIVTAKNFAMAPRLAGFVPAVKFLGWRPLAA
jgi:hypothetical protein